MAKLCMGCMNPLPEGDDTCRICGHAKNATNPAGCLPCASALQDHYIVGKVMSRGNDHILYLAYDRQLKDPCFIQEFFPATLCQREENGTVTPLGGCERPFADYADQFRTIMRGIARMRELPAIIPVYDIFEENGTVYAASDYCQGMTLSKKLGQNGGRLPWSEARPLFMSLMSCVTHLHDAGIQHLAICPDNILIDQNGKPRLRNFAVADARRVGSDLTPQLATGYAAPEQYRDDGECGFATDVYGLAATLFRTVTGNEPPAGNNRAADSDDLFMSAEVAEELTQPVCIALFNALQVDPDQRTATVAELRNQVSTEPNVTALVDEVTEEDMETAPKNNTTRNLIIIFGSCLGALLIAVIIILSLLLGGQDSEQPDGSTDNTLPTLTTTTTTNKKDKQFSVDKVVGQNYYDLRETKLGGDMTVELKHLEYSSKPAGTILSQEPKAGAVAGKETVIKVVISMGQKDEKLTIPDVSGWTEEHAKLYLEALGFRVETALLQASTFEKGLVDSTDPAIGTEKLVGDIITLRVSNVEQNGNESGTDVPVDDSVNEDTDDNGGFLSGLF